MINRWLWTTLEDNLRGKDNIIQLFVTEGLKIISMILTKENIPINAQSLRNDEYEADELAVKLVTRNLSAAISCLKKLVNYNLNERSHQWEFFDIELPLMTMHERIEELKHRINPIL